MIEKKTTKLTLFGSASQRKGSSGEAMGGLAAGYTEGRTP